MGMGPISIESGLVGYWSFDEGSDTTASDSSGYGNNGMIYGASWVSGKIRQALSFDGVDDYVQIPDHSSLDITGGITIEAWVNPNTLTNSWSIVAKNNDGNNDIGNYLLEIYPDNIIFRYKDSGGSLHYGRASGVTIPTGEWTHVAVTYTFGTGSSLKFYKNGTEYPGNWYYRSGNGSGQTTTGYLQIGRQSGGYYYADGKIDEVRIYSRVLSQSEIEAHYQEGAGGVGVIEYNPYFESGNWYRGNTHTHTNYMPPGDTVDDDVGDDDGMNSPAEVETWYKNNGYNFIALTGHNVVTPDPSVGGILHINGVESGRASNHEHIVGLGVTTSPNEPDDDQLRIDNINDQGGITILAHPNLYWSDGYTYTEAELEILYNYVGIEIYDGVIEGDPGSPYAIDKWDYVLTNLDRRIWGFAVDDLHYLPGWYNGHYYNNAGKGWIVVKALESSSDVILDAIRHGSFYASQGPVIDDISVSGNTITISLPTAADIRFYKRGGEEIGSAYKHDTSTSYTISGDEKYVRIEVTDANGYKAWSNPFFVKMGTPDTVPPPAPTLQSPSDGEIIWDSTPAFEWTEVEDPSGVTYTLQYSTDPSFPVTWFDPAWAYRAPITLTESGSDLVDYQVLVEVPYDADMQDDFDDLRFTEEDGVTELNYWVENYAGSTSARVWVKVPSIPAGNRAYGITPSSSFTLTNPSYATDADMETYTYGIFPGYTDNIYIMVDLGAVYTGRAFIRASSNASNAKTFQYSVDGTNWTWLGDITATSSTTYTDISKEGVTARYLAFWMNNTVGSDGTAWLRELSFTEPSTIYMYYGNQDATSVSDAVGVWGADVGFDSWDGWTEVDPNGQVTIDTTTDKRIEFTNAAGTVNSYIYHQLTIGLTTFRYEWAANLSGSSSEANLYIYLGDSVNPFGSQRNMVGVIWNTYPHVDLGARVNGTYYSTRYWGGPAGTTHYFRLTVASSTSVELKAWTNAARTGEPVFTLTLSNAPTVPLKYWYAYSPTPANYDDRLLSGWVDTTVLYKYTFPEPTASIGDEEGAEEGSHPGEAVTIKGIEDDNYTVPDEDALAEGTYHWRVRAVDGAGNASGWSEVWQFTVEVPFEITNAYFQPKKFNPSQGETTTLYFTLSKRAKVVYIKIYDNARNLIRTAKLKNPPAGVNSWVWDGKNDSDQIVASGKYTAKIMATSYASEKAKAKATVRVKG